MRRLYSIISTKWFWINELLRTGNDQVLLLRRFVYFTEKYENQHFSGGLKKTKRSKVLRNLQRPVDSITITLMLLLKKEYTWIYKILNVKIISRYLLLQSLDAEFLTYKIKNITTGYINPYKQTQRGITSADVLMVWMKIPYTLSIYIRRYWRKYRNI